MLCFLDLIFFILVYFYDLFFLRSLLFCLNKFKYFSGQCLCILPLVDKITYVENIWASDPTLVGLAEKPKPKPSKISWD